MTCSRGCCDTQAEHYRSVSFSAAATPTRRPQAVKLTARDKQWATDHEAYRRLRAQGIQPGGLDNCAQMEARARTRYEIEAGVPMPDTISTPKLRALINQGHDISKANNVPARVAPE